MRDNDGFCDGYLRQWNGRAALGEATRHGPLIRTALNGRAAS